ncbi:Znfinger in Ran binding protein [Pelomyxa schiedti]|nr:Znfinger in Ran binding protein [Pelomyxa schiedti]
MGDKDYFVVIDFEATCEDGVKVVPQEIIEFTSVLINARSLATEGEFHTFVRPQVHPVLTPFCQQLTGITQQNVDSGIPIDEVLQRHREWMEQHQLIQSQTGVPAKFSFKFVTCGFWPLGVCLPHLCKDLNIHLPPYFAESVMNVKEEFTRHYHKQANGGIPDMMAALEMQLQGRHHCGIDDARNVARILVRMINDGYHHTPVSAPTTTSSTSAAEAPTSRACLFNYLVVVDLEATCDEGNPPLVTQETQEVIEFPWVVVETTHWTVVDEQRFFVKPTMIPMVTPFCTHLTGITETDLVDAKPLAAVLEAFAQYCLTNFTAKNLSYCLLCDGKWDLEVMLRGECFRKGLVPIAPHFNKYFDLKTEFSLLTGNPKTPLHKMLYFFKLSHIGKPHSGIDDCKTIASVVSAIANSTLEGRTRTFQSPTEIPPTYDPRTDTTLKDFNLTRPSTGSFHKLPTQTTTTSSSACASTATATATSTSAASPASASGPSPFLVLRGLPWAATEDQVRGFLSEFDIVRMQILMNAAGRPSGLCHVQLKTPEQAVQAIATRHRANMGHRYIEVMPIPSCTFTN